jgi:conjugal transfer ATP-binding protein TraC
LQQNASAVEDAIDSKRLTIEPYGQQMLKSVHTSRGNYSEMMVIANDNWHIYRLVLDHFTQVIFSTSGKERDDILDAIDRGEDVIDVTKRFIIGNKAWNRLIDIESEIYQCIRESNSQEEIRKLISNII